MEHDERVTYIQDIDGLRQFFPSWKWEFQWKSGLSKRYTGTRGTLEIGLVLRSGYCPTRGYLGPLVDTRGLGILRECDRIPQQKYYAAVANVRELRREFPKWDWSYEPVVKPFHVRRVHIGRRDGATVILQIPKDNSPIRVETEGFRLLQLMEPQK